MAMSYCSSLDLLLPGDAPKFILILYMRICMSGQERLRIHFCEPEVGERERRGSVGAVSLEVFHARPM